MVSLEGLCFLFLFLRVVFLVESFFPVSEKLDDPDVGKVTDFREILRALEVFVFIV